MKKQLTGWLINLAKEHNPKAEVYFALKNESTNIWEFGTETEHNYLHNDLVQILFDRGKS